MDGEDADLAKVWRDDRWLMSNDLDEKSVLVYFKMSEWSSPLNTSPRPWFPHSVLRARMPPERVTSDHARCVDLIDASLSEGSDPALSTKANSRWANAATYNTGQV
jgi:hypothetical protein